MAIDVGAAAIDRPSAVNPGFTLLALDNPANATGTIDTVEIWAATAMNNGCTAGMFFLVSGTTYKARDSEALGNIAAGSKQTITGLSISITADDIIGCFYPTSGQIERTLLGFSGMYWVSGEYIDPGDQASYTLASGNALSLYGTGTESGGQTFYQTAGGASLSLAGVITRKTLKPIGGASLSISGALTKKIPLALAGAMSITGVLANAKTFGRTVGGATMVIFGGAFLRNHIIEVVSSGLSRFGRGKGGRRSWDYRRR